jgi:hypothetical protein
LKFIADELLWEQKEGGFSLAKGAAPLLLSIFNIVFIAIFINSESSFFKILTRFIHPQDM